MREKILQDCRGWAAYVLNISQDNILKMYGHDDDAPRPSKPYITMQIPSHGNVIGGWDEIDRRNNSGTPQLRISGSRWSQLQVDGYGQQATMWVEDLHRNLKRPDVRRWLRNNGPIGLTKMGSITDTTATLARDNERRVTADFRVAYTFVTDWIDSNTGIAQGLKIEGGSKFVDPTSVNDLNIDVTLK